MKKTRVISIVIALLLALSLTACGEITLVVPYEAVSALFSNGGPVQIVQGDGNAVPAPNNSGAQPGDKTLPVNDTEPGDTQPGGEEGSEPVTPSQDGVPTTKEEIIAYYVTAYNKIATEAKTCTRTYDYTSQYNNIIEINNNSTLEKLAKTLMDQYMKEDTSAVVKSASDLPPVGVTTLSISPNQISKATCEDKGTYFEVKLYSNGSDGNWEVDAQPGSGSAGVIGPLLRSEDVSGAAGAFIKFDGLHSWYGTASVTAKIDKATGHITDFDFLTPSVLHFDKVTAAVVVKVSNCNLGLLFHQKWTVAY